MTLWIFDADYDLDESANRIAGGAALAATSVPGILDLIRH